MTRHTDKIYHVSKKVFYALLLHVQSATGGVVVVVIYLQYKQNNIYYTYFGVNIHFMPQINNHHVPLYCPLTATVLHKYYLGNRRCIYTHMDDPLLNGYY